MVLVLGDFNRRFEGVSVDCSAPASAAADVALGIFRERWAAVWRGMTEIADPSPSNYISATGVSSKLDRTFCSLPAWVMSGMGVHASMLEDPALMHRNSDHAAVEMQISLRHARPASEWPIARAITRHKRLLENLQRTLELREYESWQVRDQTRLFEVAARSAARAVRDMRSGAAGSARSAMVAVAWAVSMQRETPRRVSLVGASSGGVAVDASRRAQSRARGARGFRRQRAEDLDAAIRHSVGDGAQKARRLVALRSIWAQRGQRRVLYVVQSQTDPEKLLRPL